MSLKKIQELHLLFQKGFELRQKDDLELLKDRVYSFETYADIFFFIQPYLKQGYDGSVIIDRSLFVDVVAHQLKFEKMQKHIKDISGTRFELKKTYTNHFVLSCGSRNFYNFSLQPIRKAVCKVKSLPNEVDDWKKYLLIQNKKAKEKALVDLEAFKLHIKNMIRNNTIFPFLRDKVSQGYSVIEMTDRIPFLECYKLNTRIIDNYIFGSYFAFTDRNSIVLGFNFNTMIGFIYPQYSYDHSEFLPDLISKKDEDVPEDPLKYLENCEILMENEALQHVEEMLSLLHTKDDVIQFLLPYFYLGYSGTDLVNIPHRTSLKFNSKLERLSRRLRRLTDNDFYLIARGIRVEMVVSDIEECTVYNSIMTFDHTYQELEII